MGDVWDILVAPRNAFARLRAAPRWRSAFLLAAGLGTLGALMQVPARRHVAAVLLASDAGTRSALAAMPATRREEAAAFAVGVVGWAWLAYPLLVGLAVGFAAALMALAAACAKGSGWRAAVSRLFALASNVAVVNLGLGSLALGTIVLLRGSDDFTRDGDLVSALPSLAWFAPHVWAPLAAALAQINPFTVWSCTLLSLGMKTVVDVPLSAAIPAALAVGFGGAAVAALAP